MKLHAIRYIMSHDLFIRILLLSTSYRTCLLYHALAR